jgi:hypothetical protein
LEFNFIESYSLLSKPKITVKSRKLGTVPNHQRRHIFRSQNQVFYGYSNVAWEPFLVFTEKIKENCSPDWAEHFNVDNSATSGWQPELNYMSKQNGIKSLNITQEE